MTLKNLRNTYQSTKNCFLEEFNAYFLQKICTLCVKLSLLPVGRFSLLGLEIMDFIAV